METNNQQDVSIPVTPSNFDHMFEPPQIASEEKEEEVVQQDKPSVKEERPKLSLKREEPLENEPSDDEAPEEQKEEKKKYTDWKTQAEKESKRLKETQKWANETKSQLSAYKRAVESFVNEGILLEEDGNALLDYLQYKEMPDSALSERDKASKIFRTEIDNIRKYGNYENLDEHVKALDHLVENSTQEEIEELFGEFKDLVDDDTVLFTKKILEVAATYYDEVYSDLSNAGSLKNMKLEYQNELHKRDKIIDKLEKEMVKLKKRYEDYDDSPQYRIPQGGGDKVGGSTARSSASVMKDPGAFLEEERRRNLRY